MFNQSIINWDRKCRYYFQSFCITIIFASLTFLIEINVGILRHSQCFLHHHLLLFLLIYCRFLPPQFVVCVPLQIHIDLIRVYTVHKSSIHLWIDNLEKQMKNPFPCYAIQNMQNIRAFSCSTTWLLSLIFVYITSSSSSVLSFKYAFSVAL